MTNLQQAYAYQIEWRRRQLLQHLAKGKLVAQRLAKIAVDGGDPSVDPEYCWLIGEFGEGFLIDEINKLMLTKEEENI